MKTCSLGDSLDTARRQACQWAGIPLAHAVPGMFVLRQRRGADGREGGHCVGPRGKADDDGKPRWAGCTHAQELRTEKKRAEGKKGKKTGIKRTTSWHHNGKLVVGRADGKKWNNIREDDVGVDEEEGATHDSEQRGDAIWQPTPDNAPINVALAKHARGRRTVLCRSKSSLSLLASNNGIHGANGVQGTKSTYGTKVGHDGDLASTNRTLRCCCGRWNVSLGFSRLPLRYSERTPIDVRVDITKYPPQARIRDPRLSYTGNPLLVRASTYLKDSYTWPRPELVLLIAAFPGIAQAGFAAAFAEGGCPVMTTLAWVMLGKLTFTLLVLLIGSKCKSNSEKCTCSILLPWFGYYDDYGHYDYYGKVL